MPMSLKDRWRYKNISWLMPKINVDDVLARLNSSIDSKSGDEIRAFCPDHYLSTGRESSHANWTVNVKTGKTFCFTESRGSNLVFIICRMFNCEPDEAVKFLMGSETDLDIGALQLEALKQRQQSFSPEQEEDREVKGLNVISKDMENRYMSEAAYKFFIHPPGKKYPTNILPETVDRYWVFERTWGYYTNRIIIPYVLGGYLVGFCALDMLGKEVWKDKHPLKDEKDYRKVLYPMNFVSGSFLFGYDDCQQGADFVIVTEGAREVMKLWQEGFTNSVAILGSFLGDTQLQMLTRLSPKRVVLMFDGDEAGKKMTSRIADKLERNFGDKVQRCFLPEGKDPKHLTRADFEDLVLKEK